MNAAEELAGILAIDRESRRLGAETERKRIREELLAEVKRLGKIWRNDPDEPAIPMSDVRAAIRRICGPGDHRGE